MKQTRANTLLIRTPEGIVFALLLAGPVTRFLAWLVDVACLMAILMTVGTAIHRLSPISSDWIPALGTLAYFVLQIGYGIFLEWAWRGQTIGKRLLRLRVMDEGGLRLQFSQVVIRNLLRFVDSLPIFYLVGGIACLVSRHAQRLGDFAANTIVVRQPARFEPDLDKVLGGKFNSFRAWPHLEARLRQRVSPQEAWLALQALLRRDDFEPVARIELFRDFAAHFKSVVEFPAETTEGLADEQYVRNVVDTIFRSQEPKPKVAEGSAAPALPEARTLHSI
jgi:uncharacterized RDD family membrane protein YckC